MYDTIELLRPKLHICVNWEEASQAAEALDKEFAAKLGQCLKYSQHRVYDISCMWESLRYFSCFYTCADMKVFVWIWLWLYKDLML